jgi:uncharacterized protein DUF4154
MGRGSALHRALRRCGAGLVLVAWPAWTSAQTADESALKAAFVYNFVKFTEWPADIVLPSAPIVVCVADAAKVAAELDALSAGRTVNDHAVAIRRVTWDAPPQGCAVFYLSGLDPHRLPGLLSGFKQAGTLTVSDDDRFAERGGVVGLFTESGRMRFTVNTSAVDQTRLRLSAKLLSLAKIVRD